MGLHDRLMLTLAISLAVLPLLMIVALILPRKKDTKLKSRRYRAAMTGLILALIASIPVPLLYLLLELPTAAKGDWLPVAARYGMPVALGLELIAMGLLGFGRGRIRWVGILSTVVSIAMLYATMLGLSE